MMDERNGRFRKRNNYSMVSNYILRDDDISLKAKGLYALIQSYITLDNFTLYKSFLMSRCCEGERAFDSAWKELKEAGYLKMYKIREGAKTFVYEYELLDDPKRLRAGFIYVMKNMGVFKIGRTNEKCKRLGEYTHLPETPEYVVLEYVNDNVVVERELQKAFAQKRRREGQCEWFDLNDDDIAKIRQIISKFTIDIPDRVDIERVAKFMAG